MTRMPLGKTHAQSAAATVAAALILVSFGLMIWHAFAPSVGWEGLMRYGVQGLAFGLMGVGLLVFSIALLAALWADRPQGRIARNTWLTATTRQLGVVVLNVVCYGGPVFLILGAFTVITEVPVRAAVAIAFAVLVFVGYRLHRRRNPASYDNIKRLALPAFCIALTMLMLVASIDILFKTVCDMKDGPRQAQGIIVDVQEKVPSGRSAWLDDHTLALTYELDSGKRIEFQVKIEDREALESIIDAGAQAHLTWYPKTGILASIS